MKILFCRIALMDYYKGKYENDNLRKDDIPYSKESWVKQNRDAGEAYNFYPIPDPDEKEEEICSGFVEHRGNNLHFERIKGCELMKEADSVDDVLIVWYSYNKKGEWFVVGWYNHATVYRSLSKSPTGDYFIAKAENCVLLPKYVRTEWEKPEFLILEQNHIKYANTPKLEKYAEEISERINSYDGENWLDRYPPIQVRKLMKKRRK